MKYMFFILPVLLLFSCKNDKSAGIDTDQPPSSETITNYHYTYDDKGRIKEVLEELQLADHPIVSSTSYYYDSRDSLIKKETYASYPFESRSVLEVEEFFSDSTYNRVTYGMTGAKDDIRGNVFEKKNKQGLVIESYDFYKNYPNVNPHQFEIDESRSYYEYDDNNRRINEKRIDLQSKAEYVIASEYKEIKDTLYSSESENGVLINSTKEYTIKGEKPVKIVESILAENLFKDSTFYENEKIVRSVTVLSDGYKSEKLSKYDDKGNVVQKIFRMWYE